MTNSYDQIPYTKHIYQQTQPNNLATLATLFGMQPPAVATCRVLELGCASGINTLAMAQAIPQGEFIGIDLSEQQIGEGKKNLAQLGLQNVTLKAMDIMALREEFGKFDYIVAHGVYSWVPFQVRDKILQLSHHLLQPNGVAYISYNIYPGWHLDKMLREMVIYRTKNITDPTTQLIAAKKLLNFLAEALKPKFDAYSLWLKKELQHLLQLNENYFIHEYLEEHNEPIFFHQFIEHAKQHRLQYLTDVRTPFIATDNFTTWLGEPLDLDIIEQEQYLDFLRNSPFRETLLCHQEIPLQRQLNINQINQLHIAAALQPSSLTPTQATPTQQLTEEFLQRFENLANTTMLTIASPLLKAIFLCLGEIWPQSLPFPELIQRASHLITKVMNESASAILTPKNLQETKEMLLEFYLKKIVEFSVYPPQFTLTPNDYPLASPIARLQSQQGKLVTNLRYEIFELDFTTRLILKHLDGTQHRTNLPKILQQYIKSGELILYQNTVKSSLQAINQEELSDYLTSQVTNILQNLARKAYLLA